MGNSEKDIVCIEGTLLMLDDATPHVAVPVQAISDGKVVATVLSDEGGRYQFVNLKPGEYQLRCQTLDGYIYYRAVNHVLRLMPYDQKFMESAVGDFLHVEREKCLTKIEFRFASFKKGTWRTFNYLDGLPSNDLCVGCPGAICQDRDGVMWFAADGGGVSGYDGIAWTSLDTRDGLAGNRVGPILQDQEGFLWFATQEGGVTRYRKSIISPGIRILSITTDQTYRDLSAVPASTPGTRITIEYSSIDLKTLPEKRQYRCRIKEIDPDWRKPTKSDTFDFIFDKPGTYTFEVQAIDRDLNYSEPASVKLQVIDDPKDLQIAELESEISRRNRQLEAELQDAHDMQMSLMPKYPPNIQGFDIAGFSKPAREVGGDFFDYFTTGDGKTGIAIADVSGKGLKAAMSAVLTNGMLHTESKIHTSCSEILTALNDSLCPRMMKMMFTALGLAIIEDDTLSIANAAQPYPIIKRQREAFEFRTDTDLPLGMARNIKYPEQQLIIQSGDTIIFYTDGIIEAENESGEIYGIELLLQFISIMDAGMSSEETIKAIMDDVTAFSGGAEQYDDMTIVVVKRL